MRSLLSVILSFILVVGMATGSYAATSNGNDTTISVVGNVNEAAAAETSVSVDVVWDSMTFTYNEGNPGQWSAEEHKYVGVTEGYWSEDTATITVTNHSNTALNTELSFSASVTGIIGTFTETSGTANDNTLELASAEGVTGTNVPTASAEFGIDGVAIDQDNTSLGTITVSIETIGSVSNGTPDNSNSESVGTLDELNTLLSAGGDVTLTKNYDLGENNVSVSAGTTLTLDLAGYSITGSSTNCGIENNGTLTISDSVGGGAITCSAGYGILSYGNLTVTGGTIAGSAAGVCLMGGSGTIQGGTFTGSYGATAWSPATLAITGGTFSSDPSAYVTDSRYTVTQDGTNWIVASVG